MKQKKSLFLKITFLNELEWANHYELNMKNKAFSTKTIISYLLPRQLPNVKSNLATFQHVVLIKFSNWRELISTLTWKRSTFSSTTTANTEGRPKAAGNIELLRALNIKLKAPKSKVTVNSALNSAFYKTNSYQHSFIGICRTQWGRALSVHVQRDFFHCTYFFNLVTRRGRARTQAPTTRNCTVELLTLVAIAEVSPSEVQCKGLTLEETPLWSGLLPRQVSMSSNMQKIRLCSSVCIAKLVVFRL